MVFRRQATWLSLAVAAATSGCTGEYRIGGVAQAGACAPLTLAPGPLAAIGPGRRSPYAAPWRALVRTRPASALLEGVGWGVMSLPSYDAVLPRAAAARIARVKLFTHWGDVSFDDVRRFDPAPDQRLRASLQAIAAAGLRPTITLTSLGNDPAPSRQDDVRLLAAADEGTRALRIDPAGLAKITRNTTVLLNVGTSDVVGPLITSVAADGTVGLSRALPRRLEPGTLRIATFKIAPFSRPKDASGAPSAAFAASLEGWLSYVRAAVELAKEAVGPARFDVDLGNPAATFLDVNAYYDADVDRGSGDTGAEVFAASVRALRDPTLGLGEIAIGDGVHNVNRAGGSPPLLEGVSARERNAAPGWSSLARPEPQPGVPVDALGREEGKAQGDGRWQDVFAPGDELYLPERSLTANDAYTFVWDLIDADRAHGQPPTWISATHLDLQGPAQAGVTLTPGQRWRLLVKARLREVFSYAAVGSAATLLFGLIDDPSNFVDPAAPDGGPVFAAFGRALAPFSRGDGRPVEAVRSLEVEGGTSCAAAVEFAGDGSAAHPPLRIADELVFAPFQTGTSSFAIATYAMTRSLLRVRRPDLPGDAVERFDLPELEVTLRVRGLGWSAASRATLYDPITDVSGDVKVAPAEDGSVTLSFAITDAPRVLLIEGG